MSPRPKLQRKISSRFSNKKFKPEGKTGKKIEKIILQIEEAQAISLVDISEMTQNKAAKKMKTSQSTLQRILKKARKKISTAIIKGKKLEIE